MLSYAQAIQRGASDARSAQITHREAGNARVA